jgi:hypothetical protein
MQIILTEDEYLKLKNARALAFEELQARVKEEADREKTRIAEEIVGVLIDQSPIGYNPELEALVNRLKQILQPPGINVYKPQSIT